VTAVVLVFELTGHYELTLPVMSCSIVASTVASLRTNAGDELHTAATPDLVLQPGWRVTGLASKAALRHLQPDATTNEA